MDLRPFVGVSSLTVVWMVNLTPPTVWVFDPETMSLKRCARVVSSVSAAMASAFVWRWLVDAMRICVTMNLPMVAAVIAKSPSATSVSINEMPR